MSTAVKPAVSVPARWPPGPMAWMVLVAYVGMLIVAFSPASRQLPGLQQLWGTSVLLFKTEQMIRKVMVAAMAAHTREGLYVAKITTSAGLGAEATAGWVSLTLLLGYAAVLPLKKQIAKAQRAATKRSSSS